MSVAGRTTTGKVWHVAIPFDDTTLALIAAPDGTHFALCKPLDLLQTRPLATVPAYRLCQHCERAVEQLAAAVREVQS